MSPGESPIQELAAADNSTRANPIAAGIACTNRIFRFAVTAPYTPAISTHARKNTFTLVPSAPRLNPQMSPAARNPFPGDA